MNAGCTADTTNKPNTLCASRTVELDELRELMSDRGGRESSLSTGTRTGLATRVDQGLVKSARGVVW